MGSVSVQSQVASRGERLSAIVDGELADDGHLNAFFSDLNQEDRAAWSDYHLIGDVLRSDELAVSPSASKTFLAGFAQRLGAEPHVLAPAAASVSRRLLELRRRVVPTLAVAAAAATLTWIVVPQMRGAGGTTGMQVASVQTPQSGAVQQVSMPAAAVQGGNIIRDARLDEYLEAHQQFAQQPVMPVMPLIRTSALTTQGQ
ncbi:anti-sigma factor [Burkholderia sp. WAC0059]|uniref:sigma-E factor negative regulatory protein n=1 Tax=Burkholderia sp. WAC0059 TaxID=2066022 RepID=UPI000C7F5F90|nr:RseA family anti-sigma factor [Burkholderia sp. WAC0059]PLZ02497.1 anti-sigma factor [Burkholderia sp. WAC0059]